MTSTILAALPESAPYWEAMERGVLVARYCDDCGRFHHYPRNLCPHCFSANTRWRPTAGRGTIHSYSVMRRMDVPYALAYVTMDEGYTLLTNIVRCDLNALRIGQRVQVLFEDGAEGLKMPVFTPQPD